MSRNIRRYTLTLYEDGQRCLRVNRRRRSTGKLAGCPGYFRFSDASLKRLCRVLNSLPALTATFAPLPDGWMASEVGYSREAINELPS